MSAPAFPSTTSATATAATLTPNHEFAGRLWVQKSDGTRQKMEFDKITMRLQNLMAGLDANFVDPALVTQKIALSVKPGMSTSDIDQEAADMCGSLATQHSDYSLLGGRVLSTRLHKQTLSSFVKTMELIDTSGVLLPETEKDVPDEEDEEEDLQQSKTVFLRPEVIQACRDHAARLDAAIEHEADLRFDYFAMSSLIKSNLLRHAHTHKVLERPQYMYMRAALCQWHHDIDKAIECYRSLSRGMISLATPTLQNAGVFHGGLSSCFLLKIPRDSIEGIYNTLSEVAKISAKNGGIAVAVHQVRAAGSNINSSRGVSTGILPMLRVFNNTARYVDQGGGKRKAGIAIWLEPWHKEVKEFADLRRTDGGKEFERCPDLFNGLWIPDLFLRRVMEDSYWTLFSPSRARGLNNVFGAEFDALYTRYEQEGRGGVRIKAKDLMQHIYTAVENSGTPYMAHKDFANAKSNQQHIGVIQSSNLCVHGSSLLLTRDGYSTIQELENQTVMIWNGQDWSSVTVQETGCTREWIQVQFHNGVRVQVTPQHRFYLRNQVEKPACQLEAGDELEPWWLPPCSVDIENKTEPFWNHWTLTDEQVTWVTDTQEQALKLLLSLDLFHIHSTMEDHSYVGYAVFIRQPEHVQRFLQLVKSQTVTLLDRTTTNSWRVRTINSQTVTDPEPSYCVTEPERNRMVINGACMGNCVEIVQVASRDEIAVCNLGSVSLKAFVRPDRSFDFEALEQQTRLLVETVDRLIDQGYYPVKKARVSNQRHRPMGVGVQGFADALIAMGLPFRSPQARAWNKQMAETMYWAACNTSTDLAEQFGHYPSFPGSPASQGKLQFDLWGVTPDSGRYDWQGYKQNRLAKFGLRNSLLIAYMPTASTSLILRNNECFEPYMSHLYVRRTTAGDFVVINPGMVKIFVERGLWDAEMITHLIASRGSVQHIERVPQDLKELFLTAFEIPCADQIDMCADRGPYICQSQSMNLFMANPSVVKWTKAILYARNRGLKTLMYYLRQTPATDAEAVTISKALQLQYRSGTNVVTLAPVAETHGTPSNVTGPVCSRDNPNCESCGA